MQKLGWTLALALLATPAAAQVHKCVLPDGSTTYTSAPCEGGEATPLDGISVTPGMPEAERQRLEQLSRERAQQQSDRSHQRIEEAHNEVRRIQQRNADPEKCQAARNHLFALRERGTPDYSNDLFIAREQVKLYCNP